MVSDPSGSGSADRNRCGDDCSAEEKEGVKRMSDRHRHTSTPGFVVTWAAVNDLISTVRGR